MKKLPLVSIVIPSYNHQEFVEEAIKSALNQTYPSIEVIIIDDASPDNSQKIIAKYKNNKRVKKIILKRKNQGMTKTFNNCVKESSGDYILILSSDDVLMPNIIREEISVFNKYPTVGVVHANVCLIDHKSNNKAVFTVKNLYTDKKYKISINDANFARKTINTVKYKKKFVIKKLIQQCQIVLASSLINIKCFNEVGLFDEDLMFQDYEFWFRLIRHFEIYHISKTLAKYRTHSKNLTNTDHYLSSIDKLSEINKVLKKIKAADKELKIIRENKILHIKKFINKSRSTDK